MYLYEVFRNGEFQCQCHADDEKEAIAIAKERMGFSINDMGDWEAEEV